jgi:hypothetical protein
MVAATFASLIGWTLGLPAPGAPAVHGRHPHLERVAHLVGTPNRPRVMPILRPAAHRPGRRATADTRGVLRGLRMVRT